MKKKTYLEKHVALPAGKLYVNSERQSSILVYFNLKQHLIYVDGVSPLLFHHYLHAQQSRPSTH